jgi:hypothetical protein
MFTTIRIYRDASDFADALAARLHEIEPVLRRVPGFGSYTLARTQDGVASTTTCRDRRGVEESTRIVADWVKQNVSNVYVPQPEVFTGETITEFSAASAGV